MTEYLPIMLAGSLSAQKAQVGSLKECSAKYKYFLNLFLVLFCFAEASAKENCFELFVDLNYLDQ